MGEAQIRDEVRRTADLGAPVRGWDRDQPHSRARGTTRLLVIAHTGRPRRATSRESSAAALHKNGMALRLLEDEAVELALDLPDVEVVTPGADRPPTARS